MQVITAGKAFPAISSSVTLFRNPGFGTLLFDTGSPYEQESLRLALSVGGLEPAEVDLVVLSNWHIDHIGGMGLFPRARFVASRHTVSLNLALGAALDGVEGEALPIAVLAQRLGIVVEQSQPTDRAMIARYRGLANICWRNRAVIRHFAQCVAQGRVIGPDDLALGGMGGLVWHELAGHTDGDLLLSLADQAGTHWLCAGDAVLSAGADLDPTAASLIRSLVERIAPAELRVVPGHGPFFRWEGQS